jgi:hypothetical protein
MNTINKFICYDIYMNMQDWKVHNVHILITGISYSQYDKMLV